MAGQRLSRPWQGVKALRRVQDSESDQWLSPLFTKPSQGLIDVQDEVRGGESMRMHLPWDSGLRVFYSRFYSRFAPDFTPDTRSALISLNHTRSSRFTHIFDEMIAHGHTPSHPIPVPTDRPFKARVLGSSPSRLTISSNNLGASPSFVTFVVTVLVTVPILVRFSTA